MQHRILAACVLLAITASASSQTPSSQTPSSEDGLKSLRGFRIGTSCAQLEATFDGLTREGFKAAPNVSSCLSAPGKFHVQRALMEGNGSTELLELSFAPDMTLWNVKVTMTWEGIHRLSDKPTSGQVDASLVKRFGAPFSVTRYTKATRASASDLHVSDYTWVTPLPDSLSNVDKSGELGWAGPSKTLRGDVTKATLNWFDNSPRQILVVELTNRMLLPVAIEAQIAARKQSDARRSASDASMLKKL